MKTVFNILKVNSGSSQKLSKFYQEGGVKLCHYKSVVMVFHAHFSGCFVKNDIINNNFPSCKAVSSSAVSFTVPFGTVKLHFHFNSWELAACNCRTVFKENCWRVIFIHFCIVYLWKYLRIVFWFCWPYMPVSGWYKTSPQDEFQQISLRRGYSITYECYFPWIRRWLEVD